MPAWTISRRVTAGLFLVVAITGVTGGLTYVSVTRVAQANEQVVTSALPTVVALGSIESLVKQNFINATQHLGAPAPRQAEIEREMDATSQQLTALYAEVEKHLGDTAMRQRYDAVKQLRTAYRDERAGFLKLSRDMHGDDARALLNGRFYQTFVAYTAALRDAANEMRALSQQQASASSAAALTARRTLLSGVLAALVAGSIVAWVVIRSTNSVLQHATAEIGSGSRQLTVATGQINAASQSLAQASSEQAAVLETNSAALQEMAGMAKRNADHAVAAQAVTRRTREAAQGGSAHMEAMATAMQNIQASSSSTAKIIHTIDEIAFQTNILALNAAVEAARAGEAGLGFAVVADEVRSLAQRSATAARETASSIQEAIDRSAEGAALSQRVATSLGAIVTGIAEADGVISEIASASQEQTRAVDQILASVTEMDRATQTTAATAEETAAACQELSAQSESLDAVSRTLQELVGGSDREPATSAHRLAKGAPRPVSAATSSPEQGREPAHAARRRAALDLRN